MGSLPGPGPQALPPTLVDVPALPDIVESEGRGLGPVRWLSPSQLLTTAIEVVQATIFARFADKREVMGGVPGPVFKLNEGVDDVWFDYVADTGDGYSATYATACSVMRAPNVEHLVAEGPDGTPAPACDCVDSPRSLVVLGGDEVYPTASNTAYQDRLDRPFRDAFASSPLSVGDPHGQGTPVLALPGNHDWYDGLVAFRRAFCESWTTDGYERATLDFEPAEPSPPGPVDPTGRLTRLPAPDQRDSIARLGAVQSRSYFAVRLTPTWWLWGLDSQLDKPIDGVQLRYFRTAAEMVGPDQKIILCTATPSWLEAEQGEPERDGPLFTLSWFLQRMPEVRHKVRLVLTGDKHHYSRYTTDEPGVPPHLVTCGGGGAFMSSTHHLPEDLQVAWGVNEDPEPPPTPYTKGTTFPSAEESRKLTSGFRWLAVPVRNDRLPVLVGALYLALLLSTYWGWKSVSRIDYRFDRWPVTWPMVWAVVGMLTLLGLLFAFAAHGARSSGPKAWVAAGLHTAAHWAPISWAGFWLSRWTTPELVLGWGALVWLALTAWGLFVLSLYLHWCDRWGIHELESYSGLRIEDYKSHLRVHVSGDRCTVHVLGIREVADYRKGSLDQPVRLEHVETIDVS